MALDGWDLVSKYHANLAHDRAQAYEGLERAIRSSGRLLTPKDLCMHSGFHPTDKAVMRFRGLWREFVLVELPKLEQTRKVSRDSVRQVMKAIPTGSSRWKGDREVAKARFLWFCRDLLDHSSTLLTNTAINEAAFNRKSRNLPSRRYTAVIRSFRDEELSKVLHALEGLPIAEIVDRRSDRARKLLGRLNQLWVPKLQASPKINAAPLIRAVCDHIVAVHQVVPTYNRLREILSFIPSNNVKGHGFMGILKQWRRDRHFPDALRGTMNPALPRTWIALVPTLAKVVQQAPHTFLDPRARAGRYPQPHDEVAARLGKCLDASIRSSLTIAVLNGCGNDDTFPMFADGLAQIMGAADIRRLDDPRMEDALRAFVSGDLQVEDIPDDVGDEDEGEGEPQEDDEEDASEHPWSKNKLRDFFRVYRAACYAQQRYLNALPKDQWKVFRPYMLPKLQDQVFWKASNFNFIVESAQKRRRKAKTDALFPQRGLIRTLPEFRAAQAKRLRDAYNAALARINAGEASVPYDYAVHEDEPHLGPPVRHHFRLWTQTALRRTHLPSERINARAGVDEKQARYFVEYRGASAENGEPSTNELWFADLLRFNACHRGLLRDDRSRAFMKSYGITRNQYKPMWALLCASRSLSASLSWLIADVRRTGVDFRPVYFSPEGLYRLSLYGRAANRILNITGCRVNELQQLHISSDCLTKIELERRTPAYAFMAVPKLRTDLEPFFLDENCLRFISELASCIKQSNSTGTFPKVLGASNLARHKRSGPKPYLFQYIRREPRAMRAGMIGSSVRFMLHGLVFTTSDGLRFQPGLHDIRHLTAATLRSQGVTVEVIAKMLKQKDFKVTDYYSEPTASTVVTAMQGLQMAVIGVGGVAGVRTPGELEQQFRDAEGTVGALTNVFGGLCGVGSPCGAKFSCTDCSGLIPDPKQRPLVFHRKIRLQEDLAIHVQHGMLAEVRKAEKHIADCDRVLAEMDLQEAATNDALKPVKLVEEAT